jgi:superfamily II DNA or RNA helicase
MSPNQSNIQLGDWQLAFFEKFTDGKRRMHLVASPGMGKTTAARYAAHEVLRRKENDYALVISHRRALAEKWCRNTGTNGVAFGTSIDDLKTGEATGLSVTSHNLNTSELGRGILALGKDASFLVIVDEAHEAYSTLDEYVGHLLAANERSRTLRLFTPYQETTAEGWNNDVDAEYFFQPSIIVLFESTRLATYDGIT